MDGTVNLNGADFPYIDFDGQRRTLSCIPSEQRALAAHPAWGADNEVLTERDIIDWLAKQPNGLLDLGKVGSPILNQGSTGGCAGWAMTAVFTIGWNVLSDDVRSFSPGFQYAQNNHDRDAGSTPTDNLNSLMSTGICLLEDNPSNAIFRGNIPQTAYTTAARFKAEKGYNCRGWDEMISAIALCRPFNHGIQLPRGYQNIDQRTGLPPLGGYGGLHAQCARGLFYHPELKQLVILNQNSWAKTFGIQQQIYGLGDLRGCCFLTRRHFENGYFEASALVANVPDPKDPKGIPVAPER